ncbi:hypothetical protein SHIRM173S_04477 [Streptomyces hirsutus]
MIAEALTQGFGTVIAVAPYLMGMALISLVTAFFLTDRSTSRRSRWPSAEPQPQSLPLPLPLPRASGVLLRVGIPCRNPSGRRSTPDCC